MPLRIRFPLFLISVAVILIIAPLFQQGLFIDGLLYKTVAYNYSVGEGFFWKMKFTDVSMNPFYEQPPLFFFITGIYFRLFGCSLFADRMLTVTIAICTIYILYRSCASLFYNSKVPFLILLLFLLSVQVLCWSYVNQVIEPLVCLFSSLSLLIFLKGINQSTLYKTACYAFVFAFLVPLLFLTKGFQSCFIAALPLLHLAFFRTKKSLLFGSISSILSALILLFLIFQYPPSTVWFDNYFQKRLMSSLNNVGATTNNHFEIIGRIFTELLFPFVLILTATITSRNYTTSQNKMAWVLLITAFAGSLPFAITLEQRGFYLVPSFTMYLLSLLIFFEKQIKFFYENLTRLLSKKYSVYFLYSFLAGSIFYLLVSPTLFKRDENLIKDLAYISPLIAVGDTVSIHEETWNNVPLHGYLYMQRKINVEQNSTRRFYIHDRKQMNAFPETLYKKIELPTLQYDLYKKH
jgi:4-amino-4-deoxy-L-arabinose transferase-like glycosyltransferase